MLFNSFDYLVFLPVVFALYWLLNNNLKLQNFLVLCASYFFYGSWDWRFLFLIIISTFIDYSCSIKISGSDNDKVRKWWLGVSLFANLGLLCFFKYYNFFVDSWVSLFASFGYEMTPWTLNIILPLGISFYTFQTMAYTIDVYRRKIEPCRDYIAFSAFISFFPQLVAGPIERASDLLTQVVKPRTFNYIQSVQGLRLILWGLFKKVVIADSLGKGVAPLFNHWADYTGTDMLMAGVFFAFQMYADFSGYADIAIGSAKLMGIELKSNFRFPMFSKSVLEFWQRWHISLTKWFTDYIYIPLGGSKKGLAIAIRNIFIIFLISGFWHGANWTFIIWGVYQAAFYIPVFAYRKVYGKPMIGHIHNTVLRHMVNAGSVIFTILVLSVSRLFYRAENIGQSYVMLKKMVTEMFTPITTPKYLWYIGILVFIELFIRRDERNPIPIKNTFLRYLYCSALIVAILLHIDSRNEEFLYFQF